MVYESLKAYDTIRTLEQKSLLGCLFETYFENLLRFSKVGDLKTKEFKMAAKMVNMKICSDWAETWHFCCSRPCLNAQKISARSEHFFMHATGAPGASTIQDGDQMVNRKICPDWAETWRFSCFFHLISIHPHFTHLCFHHNTRQPYSSYFISILPRSNLLSTSKVFFI